MRKEKGITLISLVITIIILIILSGVSINLTIGENGIFNKAKYAKDNYNNAVIAEEKQLNELYEYLGDNEQLYDLYTYLTHNNIFENTNETKAGTIVKLPETWQTGKSSYVSINNDIIEISSDKVGNVYAVSVGNGETVPIPVGFYYVGGNLSTGVVISDNKNDKDKYAEVTDENGKSYVGTELEGNQFVWIPCTESEYKKCNVWDGITQYYTSDNDLSLANVAFNTITDNSEKIKIQKYEGFYVGRYEAGLATTIEEYTTQQYHSGSNQVYNKEGVPQSKAGTIPWTFIDYTHSQKNAESMYNTKYVNSGLITETQWDVMINKIANIEGKSLTDSQSWGNYYNSSLTYTGRYATYDASTFYLSAFYEKQTNATTEKNTLLSTGVSETTKAYNIYDVAGNVWEWTETTGNSKVISRGASFRGTQPICFRYGRSNTYMTIYDVGFRVVLYIS